LLNATLLNEMIGDIEANSDGIAIPRARHARRIDEAMNCNNFRAGIKGDI
jgi:hypothetical protein